MMENLNAYRELIFMITVFSLFITYAFLNDLPPGLNHDAALNGIYAAKINAGSVSHQIFHAGDSGRETFFMYILAIIFSIFEPSKFSIQLTASLFGLGTITAFYFLSKLYITKGSQLSLYFGCLLSGSSALVVYSLVGWRNIVLVPFILGVTYYAKKFLTKPSHYNSIFIGVTSALAFNSYHGGRLVLLFLAAYWFFTLTKNRQNFKYSLSCILSFSFLNIPTAAYVYSNFSSWHGRAVALSHSNLDIFSYLKNTFIALKFFLISGNGNDFFIHNPVMTGWIAPFSLLAIFYIHVRFQKYWVEILIFWCCLLPAILSTPSFHRAIGVLGIIYLISFIFLNDTLSYFSKKMIRKNMLFASAVFILLLTQIIFDFNYLYVKKTPFAWGFYPNTYIVADYISKAKEPIVIHAGNWPEGTLRFYRKNARSRKGKKQNKFFNFQSYNSKDGVGISNIKQSLKANIIPTNSLWVVEKSKLKNLEKSIGKRLVKKEVLINSQNQEIAYVLKLKL